MKSRPLSDVGLPVTADMTLSKTGEEPDEC